MKATVRQTTSLLKKFIKEKFNLKVSATSDFYAGGSSLRIKYNLGLTTNHLEDEVNRLQHGNFDGMHDIYNYKNAAERGINLNGLELNTYSYVFVDREISDNIKFEIAKAFFTAFPYNGIEVPKSIEDIHKTIDINILGYWSIANYMYQFISRMNFLTQEETELSNFRFNPSNRPNSLDPVVMYYDLNGLTYNTSEFAIKEKTEEVIKEKVIISNNVRLIDYSEKAIAVIGETYEIKEALKNIGGRFNKFLNVEGAKVCGWIFPKSKENEVSNILIEYSKK